MAFPAGVAVTGMKYSDDVISELIRDDQDDRVEVEWTSIMSRLWRLHGRKFDSCPDVGGRLCVTPDGSASVSMSLIGLAFPIAINRDL
jgi:hypothetical protein